MINYSPQKNIDDIEISLLDQKDVQKYSNMILKVMSKFNKDEMTEFQKWFISPEQVIGRKDYAINVADDELGTLQFVAKYDNEIIGALELESKNFIQSFFVKEEYQNQGVGRMMFNYALDYLKKNGVDDITISVRSSNYATGFYEKLGFEGDGNWLIFTGNPVFKPSFLQCNFFDL